MNGCALNRLCRPSRETLGRPRLGNTLTAQGSQTAEDRRALPPRAQAVESRRVAKMQRMTISKRRMAIASREPWSARSNRKSNHSSIQPPAGRSRLLSARGKFGAKCRSPPLFAHRGPQQRSSRRARRPSAPGRDHATSSSPRRREHQSDDRNRIPSRPRRPARGALESGCKSHAHSALCSMNGNWRTADRRSAAVLKADDGALDHRLGAVFRQFFSHVPRPHPGAHRLVATWRKCAETAVPHNLTLRSGT